MSDHDGRIRELAIKVVVNPLLPPGTAYLIDEVALKGATELREGAAAGAVVNLRFDEPEEATAMEN